MDHPIFLYFMKANLALAVLYLCYKLLFRNDTFFRLRRFTLICIYFVVFLYQLPDISTWLSMRSGLTDVVVYYSNILPKEIVETTNAQTQPTDWKHLFLFILQLVYLTGAGVLFIRCIAELTDVTRLYMKCRKETINGVKVCVLPEAGAPYSFFGWIFIFPDQYSPKVVEEILQHESTHVRKRHSIDMIISEVATIVCWINPFAWRMKEEICINHEFEADQEVVYVGYNKKEYQYHLIGMEHSDKAIAKLYNNFSVLPLKKRISMLNQKRTKSAGRVKYLVLLPLVAALLLVNNIDAMARIIAGQPVETAAGAISRPVVPATSAPLPPDDNKVYEKCDVNPQFPGGEQKLLNYLSKNIKYPIEAQEKGEQGKVSVSFTVNKDGSLTDIKIARGISPSLDKEALRVVKAMPNWVPGKIGGKTVRATFTTPLVFRLQ